MDKIQKLTILIAGRNAKQQELSFITGGKEKW
jgi:hypothetical protein